MQTLHVVGTLAVAELLMSINEPHATPKRKLKFCYREEITKNPKFLIQINCDPPTFVFSLTCSTPPTTVNKRDGV